MNSKLKSLLSSLFIIALLLLLSVKQFKVTVTYNLKNPARSQQAHRDEEKFMTYLPHSGLHNQRISLINAMMIAKILNRTLLMPEMNIGASTGWRSSTILAQQLEHCPSIVAGREALSPIFKCHTYSNYIPVPVESLFNLTSAQERFGIKLEQRQTMKQDYWKQHYLSRLTNHTSVNIYEPLVYSLNDTARYSYQLYHKGKTGETNLDDKYATHINLESLKDRPELYMEFGSLFGGTRIALQHDDLIGMRDHLHRETGLNHSIINDVSQKIIQLLGNKYTSLHLRQGDGTFKKAVSETIQSISKALQQSLETHRHKSMMTKEDQYLVTQSLFYQQRRSMMHRLETCLSIQNLNILNLEIIYLATDAKKPKEHFKQLYEQYPCLFTLNDFYTVIAEVKYKNDHKMVDLLLPMIDAEIASHAKLFIGTPTSTFSAYIRHRNNYYYS